MNRLVSNSVMLFVALIWGTTFVAQQLSASHVGSLTYTGIRFLIGAAFVSPFAWREYRAARQRGVVLEWSDLKLWAALGLLLFMGATLQQVGVANTSVSNAGFLTALYVPMVPVLVWVIEGRRPHLSVWPAAFGSLIGTYFLSGGALTEMKSGDWWVIASTFFWAFHVLWVGRFASYKGLPILLAITQFVVCGVLALFLAPFFEEINIKGIWDAMPTILYGGLLSVGIAYTLQVVAQRHTRAADAAILLSSEILFSAMAAVLYLGEKLSTSQITGGFIIFACVVAVQLMPLLEVQRRT